MLKNKIILLSNYLEYNIITVFVILLLSPIFVDIGGYYMYITLLIVSMFILFVYIKTKVHSGKLKLDKSIYDVPEIDDVLIVVKPFYYDGSVLKYRIYSMHSKPNTIYIEKGTELKVKNISAQKYDWILQINNNMYLEYFQTKKYWITKKNLREKKLNKILK